MRVAFGQFVVDTQLGRLLKNGVEVKLRDQPLQVLLALLRDPGEVVSRDALRQQLWGDSTYVDFDNGLNTAMSRLREVLEDDSNNPSWIERIPRRGYRFIGALLAQRLSRRISRGTTSSPHIVPKICGSHSPSSEKPWQSILHIRLPTMERL